MSNPEVEIRSFKQPGGESLKDAWYRINNAHHRCTKKHSATILLRNFYVVWTPGSSPDIALLPINSLRWENPIGDEHFSRKHTASRRYRHPEIGRFQKLFPAPCQRGESSPEAFFITMPASRVMHE
jgi:hypothetical protein